jgi:hypothetical protein
METEFTLSRLAEIAHAPKRAVQLWADAGVIEADPSTMLAGSGVHRRFRREEVIIACIIAPFAKQKVAIGGLEAISIVVRGFLRKDPQRRRIFEDAIAGQGRNYFLAYWCEKKDGELYISGVDLANQSEDNFFDRMSLFDQPSGSHKPKPAIKIDAVALNEVLRDVPEE